jgi:transcriptional regulator with XRE-family HTH domain
MAAKRYATYLDEVLTERGMSTAQLAFFFKVSPNAARKWRMGESQLSPAHAIQVSKDLGIPLHKLRPDIWDGPLPEPPAIVVPKIRRPRKKQSTAPKKRSAAKKSSDLKKNAAPKRRAPSSAAQASA